MTKQARHLVGFEQGFNTAGELTGNTGLAGLHGIKVKAEIFDTDAVTRKLFLGPMVELGGFQQGLGRNAACIQTGATKGGFAVPV